LKSLRPGPLRVGVIGLGAGSLAAYAERGDLFRFYEINPLVEKLSREQFTYLSDCRGKTEVILGDGRLSLEREPDQHYDLLAVDAFSGDSIPVHLITRQALELYFRHLRPGGILALHVTNSHLNLPPVVETLRRGLGMYAVIITNERDGMRRVFSADWALLSSRQITDPEVVNSAGELPFRPELRAWTDDYNNLFQILK
jgi:spermidine synthase